MLASHEDDHMTHKTARMTQRLPEGCIEITQLDGLRRTIRVDSITEIIESEDSSAVVGFDNGIHWKTQDDYADLIWSYEEASKPIRFVGVEVCILREEILAVLYGDHTDLHDEGVDSHHSITLVLRTGPLSLCEHDSPDFPELMAWLRHHNYLSGEHGRG
jgi:hypothetical protein